MNDTIELLTRTLCDLQPKNPTNGVYLYCQTKSNQQSINYAMHTDGNYAALHFRL